MVKLGGVEINIRFARSDGNVTFTCVQAISYGGLQAYLGKSNKQVEEIVQMVRGRLSKMARITLEALIVIDVHGQC